MPDAADDQSTDRARDSDPGAEEGWKHVEEVIGFELDDEFRAWAEHAEVGEIAAELNRRRPKPDPLPPAPELTDHEARRDRERQICVRLWPEHYEELTVLAAEYGLSPTAMARLLVRRGIKAANEARS
jgi:hypothetical protein